MKKTFERFNLASLAIHFSLSFRFSVSLLCLAVFAGAPLCAFAQHSVPNAHLAAHDLNAKVEALLKQMTLEEKIGQTVQYSAGFATGPAGAKLSYDELTQQGAVGSMLNVYGAEKTNHYQHIAMEKSRLHIPLIFGMDVCHGDHTTFPVPLGLASSWGAKVVEGVARTSAVEARADGLQWVFSPMVDIARDARWGRI